jgi:hypothetical protein
MDAFESIVAGLLRMDGYWVINGYRVALSKEEKSDAGKPSMPRPEIDILAYKAKDNELIWVECKSFFDSGGVRYSSFTDENDVGFNRYKIFNNRIYRDVLSKALIRQTVEKGFVKENPKLSFCLVAGKIHSESDKIQIREHFNRNDWVLRDDGWLNEQLDRASKSDYENDIVTIVSKIIKRNLHISRNNKFETK